MSIASSLSNALSGLNISGRRAQVVSENIAHAQTEGYGRRELATSSGWSGPRVDGIIRNVDRGLVSDRRIAESQLGADQRTADMLGKIEALVGAPGDADSLVSRLSKFETSLIFAANEPSSDQRLEAANTALKSVGTYLHQTSDGVQNLRETADAAIGRDISELNASLQRIEQLNADISRTRSAGQDVSNLLDIRHQVVDAISEIVPLRQLDRGNDQLALMSTNGLVLIDGRAAKFAFENTPTITAEMTLTTGGLSGITLNGAPLDPANGYGRLSGGSLSAAFAQRDGTLVQAQDRLDAIALDLIERMSDPSIDPTAGAVGLLTDGGGPVDPSDITGLATRLQVNVAADPSQGGVISAWRDGVNAASPGPLGDSGQLNRWREALTSFGGHSIMDKAADLSANLSRARLDAETELSFSAARWDSLHNAELAGGVDTDVELQNLLLVEQAYAANAKVIQTVSAMMQQLMEI